MKKNVITTVRDLSNKYPEMYDYNYKWRNTDNPELEKNISDVLADKGYKLTEEDSEFEGNYNDLKGYLNCSVELI